MRNALLLTFSRYSHFATTSTFAIMRPLEHRAPAGIPTVSIKMDWRRVPEARTSDFDLSDHGLQNILDPGIRRKIKFRRILVYHCPPHPCERCHE